MKGRAYELLTGFRQSHPGLAGTFLMSRLILISKIVPERITPDLDDNEVEGRIEAAIARIAGPRE